MSGLSLSGIISGDRYLSPHALETNAARAASALHSAGVWQGDTVALLLRNDFAYFEATRGAGLLGATTVPLNWHMTASEISYVLEDCDAKVLVGHADLLTEAILSVCSGRHVIAVETPEEIAEAYNIAHNACQIPGAIPEWYGWLDAHEKWNKSPVAPSNPMFYTSGTSGMPKGVRRQPVAPEVAQRAAARSATAWGLDAQGVVSIMTGPLYHSAPNAYGMSVVRSNGLLILQPRFDAENLLRLVSRYSVTHLHMVPTMFVRLLAVDSEVRWAADMKSLRFVAHGAAPCPPDIKRQMIEWWGPVIYEYYAMTETGIITTCDSEDWLDHPGSVGCPVDGVDIKILGDNGQFRNPGDVGQICVRSETTPFVSYHRAADQTQALRRGDYVLTGDVGYLDTDGFLFINDRMSDMVISGGVNIYPVEIEKVLIAMSEISDCAVFGVPDAEYGERLIACIESRGPVNLEAIKDLLGQQLASYKIPREFHFDLILPREDSGKIKKRLLRDAFVTGEHRDARVG
ncbi:AMP-binding protein [Luminiphilus sp.]|nr:AMP-binding protein [Luminiphilus sp.]